MFDEIITHSGIFHADDVVSCALLRIFGGDIPVVRTRDPEKTAPHEGAIIVDVGEAYNHERRIYDHHQDAGARPCGVRYAGAGLIWKHYGPDFIRYQVDSAEEANLVVNRIDEAIIQGIDAQDNGQIEGWASTGIINSDYRVSHLSLSSIISSFVPDDPKLMDDKFECAVRLAYTILDQQIKKVVRWAIARKVVADALAAATNRIMVLPYMVPWREHLTELDTDQRILYVVFRDPDTTFAAMAVSQPNSMASIKPFPKPWREAKPETMERLTGVSDFVFCHRVGFILKTKSLESTLTLARLAVEA